MASRYYRHIIFITLEKSEQKFCVYLLYYVLTTQFPLYLTWTICKNLEKIYWDFVMQCVILSRVQSDHCWIKIPSKRILREWNFFPASIVLNQLLPSSWSHYPPNLNPTGWKIGNKSLTGSEISPLKLHRLTLTLSKKKKGKFLKPRLHFRNKFRSNNALADRSQVVHNRSYKLNVNEIGTTSDRSAYK